MPRGDQTGPMGMGRITGRAAGYCAGFGAPGYQSPALGRGFYRDRRAMDCGFGGGGRGWRNWFYATRLPGWMRFGRHAAPYPYQMPYDKPNPELEREALKNEAENLRSELEWIEKRLADIKEGTGEK